MFVYNRYSDGLDEPGLIPGSARFSSSPQRPDRFWGPPSLLSNGYLGVFPRGLRGRGMKLTSPEVELCLHSSIYFHGKLYLFTWEEALGAPPMGKHIEDIPGPFLSRSQGSVRTFLLRAIRFCAGLYLWGEWRPCEGTSRFVSASEGKNGEAEPLEPGHPWRNWMAGIRDIPAHKFCEEWSELCKATRW
jgi:hypothetical protein